MKIIHKLANVLGNEWFAFSVGVIFIFLLASCTAEPYYECYDNFRPEQVIIEGREVTIYHKELVCNEYY